MEAEIIVHGERAVPAAGAELLQGLPDRRDIRLRGGGDGLGGIGLLDDLAEFPQLLCAAAEQIEVGQKDVQIALLRIFADDGAKK